MKKCVKCLGPISDEEFVVNKYMAYCAECAKLLHLGESKESRMLSDFHVTGRQPPEEMPVHAGAPDMDAPVPGAPGPRGAGPPRPGKAAP
jgi:hypothetical protein